MIRIFIAFCPSHVFDSPKKSEKRIYMVLIRFSGECLTAETLYVTPIGAENGDGDDSEDGEPVVVPVRERRCIARCPASPITIPASKLRTNSVSQPKSPKPRRQRTTSTSLNTNQNEAIIRSNKRTIYTAGRPPW